MRSLYVKVSLTEPAAGDLTGCTVVGHLKGAVTSLLLERPEPKPKAAKTVTRKPKAPKAAADPAPATSFDTPPRIYPANPTRGGN